MFISPVSQGTEGLIKKHMTVMLAYPNHHIFVIRLKMVLYELGNKSGKFILSAFAQMDFQPLKLLFFFFAQRATETGKSTLQIYMSKLPRENYVQVALSILSAQLFFCCFPAIIITGVEI